MEVFRENYVGNFIQDVVSALKEETFDRVVWVGMHGWMQYAAKAIWQMGWKMDTAITNSDSRWEQEICADTAGHTLTFRPFDTAQKTGNDAVYVVASRQAGIMAEQLISLGITKSRILVFGAANKYLDAANKRLEEKHLHGLRQLSHKETQKALFEIMKVFRDFCDENNLRYYMAAGTLLGAVRHQGFVPWDNDVDFQMPIQDYLRFREIYIGSRYKWMDHSNSPLLLSGSSKLVDTEIYSFLLEAPRITYLGIDIIPIGCYPRERLQLSKERKEWEDFWEKVMEDYFLRNFSSLDYPDALLDRYISWAKRDGDIIAEAENSRLEVDKKLYSEPIDLSFEGEKFTAAKGYEEILRIYYGNYLSLPPLAQRVGFKVENYYTNKSKWIYGKQECL